MTSRLTSKLIIGITVLLILAAASALLGYTTTANMQKSFNTFVEANAISTMVNEIERDIREIQRTSRTYSYTGNTRAPQQISKQVEVVRRNLVLLTNKLVDEDSLYHVRKIKEAIDNYWENFQTLQQEREIRTRLVEEDIQNSANRIRELLNEIKTSTGGPESLGRRAARNILHSVADAELSAYQFLNNPDSDRVQLVNDALLEIQARLDSGEQNEFINDDELKQLQQDLHDLQRAFLRTVQATRGYLYLINVVMAGEAAEITYHTDRLQERATQNRSELLSRANSVVLRSTKQFISFTIFSAVVAILIGYLFNRWLVLPVTQLTETFIDLTNARDVDSIPHLDRKDEIGEMARAANVFKEKNQRTVELLQQTQRDARELSEQTALLKQSNEDLVQFAYVASHDLREPLRAVSGYCTLLEMDCQEQLDETGREYVKNIVGGANRMQQLINDLLEYSRVNRKGAAFELTDLSDIVNDAIEILEQRIQETNTIIKVESLPVVNVDRIQMLRVFQNLIENAIKYRRGDPPEIRISTTKKDAFWNIKIQDNGIGIEREYWERIFIIFQRLHTREKYPGTGIGLAVCQRITQRHAGSISVESVHGEGSTFVIELPVAE